MGAVTFRFSTSAMPCPTCHSSEYTLEPGAASGKPTSFLRRLFGSSGSEAPASGRRRCTHCGTVYEEAAELDDDERRLEERRARMEERMSGFRDSGLSSSLFPEEAEDDLPPSIEAPAGKAPPTPLRKRTLEELAKLGAGIEMQKPEGIKCRKCGHFAFVVRTPEAACAGCGRVYAKMDEEAEAERLEAIRRAEKGA